jgi:hypothetical protein
MMRRPVSVGDREPAIAESSGWSFEGETERRMEEKSAVYAAGGPILRRGRTMGQPV